MIVRLIQSIFTSVCVVASDDFFFLSLVEKKKKRHNLIFFHIKFCFRGK